MSKPRRCSDCGKWNRALCVVERRSTMAAPLSEAHPIFYAELCHACFDVAEAAYCVTYGTKPRPFQSVDLSADIKRVEAAQAKRARKARRRAPLEVVGLIEEPITSAKIHGITW